MKKNKKLLLVLLVIVMLMSGCTKYLTDSDNKRVTNEVTGQPLTSNILCLPKDNELVDLYQKNKKNLKVNYNKLNECEKFKPSDVKYNGLWESLFVKPLAFILIKLGLLVKNYGLSVIILGLLIRIVILPLSKKSLLQSENMKKAQPELQKLQEKYANATSREAQLQMSQEMMMIYKKYNINPASGCLMAFIQLPLFLAFLEAINRVPVIFEENFLTLQLGTNPFIGIKSGNYLYILVIVLIILSTYFSYKYTMNTSTGNKEQDLQMNMMMKFMIVFIAFASLSLPTAIALYWIVSNAFMVVQNFIIKRKKEVDYVEPRTKKREYDAKIIKEKKKRG